jgi:hypothetical protein
MCCIWVDICDRIRGNAMITSSDPPESNNPTSSLALLNMWFVATNSDILDGV